MNSTYIIANQTKDSSGCTNTVCEWIDDAREEDSSEWGDEIEAEELPPSQAIFKTWANDKNWNGVQG